MSEVITPKTYHFQGLEVSKPSSYKSLNSSSTNPNLCKSYKDHDNSNYQSLMTQIKNLFVS